MASCEKCWKDAQGSTEKYQQLIKEREDNPCSPEEQAGLDAEVCKKCKRKTVHQHIKVCMVCGVRKV